MENFLEFLIANGQWGMFVSAFLAGSVVPLNSETVMVGLLLAGADPVGIVVWGTLGNVLGGLFNYFVGSLGKEEWIMRISKVPPEKLERGMRHVRRYGAWAGLMSWVPVVGELITIAMGFMRVSLPLSVLTITIGKYVRYQILVSAFLAAQ